MTERFDTFRPPPVNEPDWDAVAEAEPETDARLDPRAAAALLEETRKEAERAFDVNPVLLMLAGTATVLIAYGALWLSVRHQHPYTGPTGTGLGVLYGAIAVWVVVALSARARAVSGVGGRAARERRLVAVGFAVPWALLYVFQGALAHAGASHAIVYGIYPATAPLIVVGAAAAAHAAARENGPELGFALAAVALGSGAAFAGPRAVWLAVGIGLAVLVFSLGAFRTWQRRART